MIRRCAVALVAAMISCAPAVAFEGACGPSGAFNLSTMTQVEAVSAKPILAWFAGHAGAVPWSDDPVVRVRDFAEKKIAALAFTFDGRTCVLILGAEERDAMFKALGSP